MNSSILKQSSPVNVEKKKRRHLGRKPLLVGSTPAEQARIEKRRYDCKINQRRHRARKKRLAAELTAQIRNQSGNSNVHYNRDVLKAANILRNSCFLNNGENQQHAVDSLARKAFVETKSPLLVLTNPDSGHAVKV